MNQLIGSAHSDAPVTRCRPTGTPIIGLPVPAAKGQRPQTWTLVARHSGACLNVGHSPSRIARGALVRGQHDAERQASGEPGFLAAVQRPDTDARGGRELLHRALGGGEPLGVRRGRCDQQPEAHAGRHRAPPRCAVAAADLRSVSMRDVGRLALRTVASASRWSLSTILAALALSKGR